MVICEGQLRGAFKGFKNTDTVFEFYGGRKWKQAVYQYEYFYAYMPQAKVVQEGGAYVLKVQGMSSSVAVRPA
ncbi:hypothetical protein [Pseudomonas sp. HN2-3]|uniref:hypothetical protein n=1 Tax=Pseudomonas sp. HN2-3 TaxID=2886360 RepID=UPI001D103274|nr:hypothetical protein [Pseudomonas sp. HN2-3]UDU79083.1 hypothetical protein LJX93_14870 [Pseudomonas sp. HN2-3]